MKRCIDGKKPQRADRDRMGACPPVVDSPKRIIKMVSGGHKNRFRFPILSSGPTTVHCESATGYGVSVSQSCAGATSRENVVSKGAGSWRMATASAGALEKKPIVFSGFSSPDPVARGSVPGLPEARPKGHS